MRNMNQPGFQQGWERFEVFLFDSQSDAELKNFQTVFPGFEQPSSSDLPLNLADTECQISDNDQNA